MRRERRQFVFQPASQHVHAEQDGFACNMNMRRRNEADVATPLAVFLPRRIVRRKRLAQMLVCDARQMAVLDKHS